MDLQASVLAPISGKDCQRNIKIVYDLTSDFPNFRRRHNQNTQSQSQLQDDQPSTITASNATPIPAPAVTVDALAKFKEDTKQEFMSMIQNEVKTQIQAQMKALQTDVQMLASKFDGMKEGIQTSIGEIVQSAIMQGLNTQTTQRMHTQQPTPKPVQTENAQDGPCPMLTGTDS